MNSLEDSIRASSRITNDLLSKTAAMRTIINQQRTQSAADLANYRKSQEAWKNESASYEATIASLSQSYRDLQIEREAEKERADTLEKKNLRKTIAIVILSAVMAIILAALIVIVFRRK
ncbi:MAG: hypothetical protein LBQ88_09085 [Treponema sp.]|jgi:Fe2+ transport system protein B|nr:hypothetical protein [Treponema sp.]